MSDISKWARERAREIVHAPDWFEGVVHDYTLHPDTLERMIAAALDAACAEGADEMRERCAVVADECACERLVTLRHIDESGTGHRDAVTAKLSEAERIAAAIRRLP